MTIMSRAEAVLRDHGEDALADELRALLDNVNRLTAELRELHKKKDAVTAKYINVVQARCEHPSWILHKPDTISCRHCGHTVCNFAAYRWGEAVLGKPYDWKYTHYVVDGRRFKLDLRTRKMLGDLLIVKEMKDEPDGETKTQATGPTETNLGPEGG